MQINIIVPQTKVHKVGVSTSQVYHTLKKQFKQT